MTTPRQAYKIDTNNPESDLAGETTASIVFRQPNPDYSNDLLGHAKHVICSDSQNLKSSALFPG